MFKGFIPCGRAGSTSERHGAFADVVVPIDAVPLGSNEDPCAPGEEPCRRWEQGEDEASSRAAAEQCDCRPHPSR